MMLKTLRQVASLFLLILLLSSAIMSLARLQDPRPPWIAFACYLDYQLLICRMRFDGSQQERFIYDPFNYALPSSNTVPSWSSDGKWILFNANGNHGPEIYRMRPNEEGNQVLPRDPKNLEIDIPRSDAAWSPDGQWVLFNTKFGPNSSEANLFRMRPDGSELQQLTQGSIRKSHASWSPNSQQIIFVLHPTVHGQIYRMNADGSEQINLTDHRSLNTSPTWSPDGEWILFISRQDGVYKLYRMRSNGKEHSPYLEHLENMSNVHWVSDGQHLLLTIAEDEFNMNIYRYHIASDELLRLTDTGDNSNPAPSPIIDLPWRAGVILLLSLALLAFAIPPQALYRSLKRR